MKSNTKIDWQLLIRIARGTASASEKERFENWINENPEKHKRIFEEIKEDYSKKDDVNDSLTPTDVAFNRIMKVEQLETVYEDTAVSFEPVRKYTVRNINLKVASIAAGFLLLFSTGAWMFHISKQNKSFMLGSKNEPDLQEVIVGYGRQTMLTLQDGSLIRLAPGSKFKYPKSFGTKERRVYLEGEAFFEVTRDTARPFIVQTSSLETKVLGTSFNIESFTGQPLAKVIVVTGKVSVSKYNDQQQPELLAYLTPDSEIVYNSGTDSFTLGQISKSITEGIQRGQLVFDGSSLKEIAEALKLRYGVEAHFSDKRIAAMHLTTMLDYSSIDHIASMLSVTANLEVMHKDGHLYFNKK